VTRGAHAARALALRERLRWASDALTLDHLLLLQISPIRDCITTGIGVKRPFQRNGWDPGE